MSKEFHYKALVQYNGSGYSGFQIQKNGEKTIQGELYSALKRMGVSEYSLIPSGRTDAGVHALGQVIKLSLSKDFESKDLLRSLNSILGTSIFLKELERCSEDFSPRTNAISKTYSYVIFNSKDKPTFHSDLVTHVPYDLDLTRLETALNLFVGIHDFRNFFTVGSPVSSTRREIFEVGLTRDFQNPFLSFDTEDLIVLNVSGNGFLKQMVRLIVGAVLNHAQGRVSIEEIKLALSAKSSMRVGATAPANGLYLREVEYPS